MIQLTCVIKDRNPRASAVHANISIPETLACAVSWRLRDLCSQGTGRVFTADEVVGVPIADFERRLICREFHRIMTSFVKWLYGSPLDDYERACDRWHLGQQLGSPKFQNATMHHLCKRPEHYDGGDIGCVLTDCEPLNCDNPQIAWELSDFSKDEEHGFENEDDEIYWGNKQMLKFYLDVYAFFGTREALVRQILESGGKIAIQLSMLIEEAHRSGGFDGAPWKEKNIHKYLVDETMVDAPTTASSGTS